MDLLGSWQLQMIRHQYAVLAIPDLLPKAGGHLWEQDVMIAERGDAFSQSVWDGPSQPCG